MKGASWSRFVLFLCCLFLPLQASAQDEIIIEGAHYPEGLFWDQRTSMLYYAEMPRDRIMRHVSGAPSVFFAHKGCGPTGIAPIGDQWAIACHIGRSLVIADQEGRFVREIKSDGEGRALQNPNDIVSDGTGVYLSDSGTFNPKSPASGAIYYWQPGHDMARLLSGLHYANGVTIKPDGETLFVSEHLGRRILAVPIHTQAHLGEPRVFADIGNLLTSLGPLTGPDGLEFGENGHLYAAIYGAGRVMVFTASGAYARTLRRPETYLTTVSYMNERNALFTAGAFENLKYPYEGNISRVCLDLK